LFLDPYRTHERAVVGRYMVTGLLWQFICL